MPASLACSSSYSLSSARYATRLPSSVGVGGRRVVLGKGRRGLPGAALPRCGDHEIIGRDAQRVAAILRDRRGAIDAEGAGVEQNASAVSVPWTTTRHAAGSMRNHPRVAVAALSPMPIAASTT